MKKTLSQDRMAVLKYSKDEEPQLTEAQLVRIEQLKQLRSRSSSNLKVMYKTNLAKLRHYNERRWMKSTGRAQCIIVSDKERLILRQFFNFLDSDKQGFVRLMNFVNPLMAMGLIETREEFFNLARQKFKPDQEFLEFHDLLHFIQSTPEMKDFFKKLIHMNQKSKTNQLLSFDTIFCRSRRKHFMNACTSSRRDLRAKGQQVLTAYVKEQSKGKIPIIKPHNRKESTLIYKPPVGSHRYAASVPKFAKENFSNKKPPMGTHKHTGSLPKFDTLDTQPTSRSPYVRPV